MIAASASDILHFLLEEECREKGSILVTLTGTAGSSSRALGSQMAVCANGQARGSFSGGCMEAAVIAEALDTLATGKTRIVRFGDGSPYIDIKLPCGGGMDLLFLPNPDPAMIRSVLNHLRLRMPVTVGIADGPTATDKLLPTGWRNGVFYRRYWPVPRIIALGQGEDLIALARLAHYFGCDMLSLSPDRHSIVAIRRENQTAQLLSTRTSLPNLVGDPWSAIVFLFHDRDWEEYLLPQALALDAFYYGAVGSPRTQRARREALLLANMPQEKAELLRSSIGLIPSTRDPATLALSILSEIIDSYNLYTSIK